MKEVTTTQLEEAGYDRIWAADRFVTGGNVSFIYYKKNRPTIYLEIDEDNNLGYTLIKLNLDNLRDLIDE